MHISPDIVTDIVRRLGLTRWRESCRLVLPPALDGLGGRLVLQFAPIGGGFESDEGENELEPGRPERGGQDAAFLPLERAPLWIEFEVAKVGRLVVEIIDQQGWRVARLVDCVMDVGRTRVAWDGRDDMGRAVDVGNYYALVKGNGFSEVFKF